MAKKEDGSNKKFATRVLAWLLIIAMVSATLIYVIALVGSK